MKSEQTKGCWACRNRTCGECITKSCQCACKNGFVEERRNIMGTQKKKPLKPFGVQNVRKAATEGLRRLGIPSGKWLGKTFRERWEMSELDICECGDYRKQHEDGKGRCIFKDHHGMPDCLKFRLSKKG